MLVLSSATDHVAVISATMPSGASWSRELKGRKLGRLDSTGVTELITTAMSTMPNIYGKENIVVLSAELLRRKDSEGRAGGTYSSADDEVIIDMEAARFPPRDKTHYDNRGREGDKGGDDTG